MHNPLMALEFTASYVRDSLDILRYYKRLAEGAIEQVPDEMLAEAPDGESNSIATSSSRPSRFRRSLSPGASATPSSRIPFRRAAK